MRTLKFIKIQAMNGSMEKEPVMAKSVSQYHTMDVRRPSNHSHEHEHNCIAEACDATSDDGIDKLK